MGKVDLVKFLKCYEEHPCLWDPQNTKHKHRQSRNAALSSMIKNLKLSINLEELKTKIKSVRTMYARECGKISASKKSGARIEDVYIPNVPWFVVADRFLKPIVEGKHTKTNTTINTESNGNRREREASYSEDVPSGSQAKRSGRQTKTLLQTIKTESNGNRRERETSYPDDVPSGSQAKRSRRQTKTQAVNTMQSISQANAPDEFNTFGAYVAVQLRNMPLEEAISSQASISNYLARRRINILRLGLQYTTRSESSQSSEKYPAQDTNTTVQSGENNEVYLDGEVYQDDVEEESQAEEEDRLYCKSEMEL